VIFSHSGQSTRERGRHADHEGLLQRPGVSVQVESAVSAEGNADRAAPRVGERDLVGGVSLASTYLGEPGAERGGGVGEAAVRGEHREARFRHAHLLQEFRVVHR
jgi:hypothetical protein